METNKERKPGYYWVNRYNEWIIARYSDYGWFLTGVSYSFEDNDFSEIDERQITRQETKTQDAPPVIANEFKTLPMEYSGGVKDLTKPQGHDMNHLL